jgi:hypothetical protein
MDSDKTFSASSLAGKGFVVFNLDEFFARSSMLRCPLLAFSIARFWSAKNIPHGQQPSSAVAQKQAIRPR